MASELTERVAAAPQQAISFAVDGLTQGGDGRVEVTGRWFGVRGRRFVRPTLTAAMKSGNERRALADLDHKPWAAEDGERWLAAFSLDVELENADELELNVAPDINIPLEPGTVTRKGRRRAKGARSGKAPGERTASTGRPAPAKDTATKSARSTGSGRSGGSPRPETSAGEPTGATRSAGARSGGTGRPSMADRAQELERLRDRVHDLQSGVEREQRRREQAEHHLEEERTEALRLRSEVGRLSAELDIAIAARDELTQANAELEETRTQAISTDRELDSVRNELEHASRRLTETHENARHAIQAADSARSETVQAQGRVQEMQEQLDALGNDRETVAFALEQERAETARLQRELADSEDAVRRLAGSRSGNVSLARPMSSETGPSLDTDAEQGKAGRNVWAERDDRRLEAMSPRLRALNKLEVSTPPVAERPINPSLLPGNWVTRGLAVVVVLIVLVAVVIILNSTIG
jgi:hypothetical protein